MESPAKLADTGSGERRAEKLVNFLCVGVDSCEQIFRSGSAFVAPVDNRLILAQNSALLWQLCSRVPRIRRLIAKQPIDSGSVSSGAIRADWGVFVALPPVGLEGAFVEADDGNAARRSAA